MIDAKSQKLNAKKKYSEPSIKEIGKISNQTLGAVGLNADSPSGASS